MIRMRLTTVHQRRIPRFTCSAACFCSTPVHFDRLERDRHPSSWFPAPTCRGVQAPNGFGVVFSDVDVAGPTAMQYFGPDGSSLGTFTVPATPGQADVLVHRRDLQRRRADRASPDHAGQRSPGGWSERAGPVDVVVTDDFIFGDPLAQVPPAPPAPPALDRTPPALNISGVPKQVSLKKLRGGVKFSVDPNEESQIDVTLVAKAKKATISANGDLVLAARSFDFSTATRQGKLKPKKSLIGKAKKFTVRLQVEAIDRSGNKATVTRKIKVKGQ